ncbi:phosphonate C-P lyase system protein PhnG [Marinobacterium aestuarii]|uniref:Phosphonate C-P lyase system protein PhnG n=1 Tax=Marinobacterium aestuarii TaxID=1821621 RepID=A0A1A9F0U5_9GAMM|nr:phosphonate C-P lyase system protein PhnG [Marinobacterium aestuarii]ANG63785.1 phosphonate C-P lyase system protein PhnG [Marinobacterium aestuarii]
MQNPTPRQHWMSILARAPRAQLCALYRPEPDTEFELIRAPETGLTQVRARSGGTGAQFNLGDMTLTRCVVRSPAGHLGYAFVAGRDRQQARLAAELDALLQESARQTQLLSDVIEPLARQQRAARSARAAEADSTKVDFFTLVRGED